MDEARRLSLVREHEHGGVNAGQFVTVTPTAITQSGTTPSAIPASESSPNRAKWTPTALFARTTKWLPINKSIPLPPSTNDLVERIHEAVTALTNTHEKVTLVSVRRVFHESCDVLFGRAHVYQLLRRAGYRFVPSTPGSALGHYEKIAHSDIAASVSSRSR